MRPRRAVPCKSAFALALAVAGISLGARAEEKPARSTPDGNAPSPEKGEEAASAEAEPPPAVRYPPSRVRVPLILGGLGLTAVAYGAGAVSAAVWPNTPGTRALYIPVAGPWITLAQDRCSDDDQGCSAILYVRAALYVVGGLVQLGGLAVAAEGMFATTEANAPEPKKASIHITPLASPQLAGIGLSGEF